MYRSCALPAALLLAALTVAGAPRVAAGQTFAPEGPRSLSIIPTPPEPSPPPGAHLGAASVNGILTGLASGTRARLEGRSFTHAFAYGVVGGGVAYLGKWTATREFSGAGWGGRWVQGLGVSMADPSWEGMSSSIRSRRGC